MPRGTRAKESQKREEGFSERAEDLRTQGSKDDRKIASDVSTKRREDEEEQQNKKRCRKRERLRKMKYGRSSKNT